MVFYPLVDLTSASAFESAEHPSSVGNRYKIAVTMDSVVAITLLVLSILAIISYLGPIEMLISMSGLYPVGAYTMLGVACGMGLIDLALYLIKKNRDYPPIPPAGGVSQACPQTYRFSGRGLRVSSEVRGSAARPPNTREAASRFQSPWANGKSFPAYRIGDLGEDADRDPLFDSLEAVDAQRFDSVSDEWMQQARSQGLESDLLETFRQFLHNLSTLSIQRQAEVFSDKSRQLEAYNQFKRGVIHLFDAVQKDSRSGPSIIRQLVVAVGECPLTYHSVIGTSLLAVSGRVDVSGTIEERAHQGVHQLSACFRREVVEFMATYLGRRETHTVHSIVALIGRERKIPGARYTIQDRQADLTEADKGELLREFDRHHTAAALINWFVAKVNGKKDGKYYLHLVIPEYIAAHFGVAIEQVREVVFDQTTYLLSEDAIITVLELVGILKMSGVVDVASVRLQRALS